MLACRRPPRLFVPNLLWSVRLGFGIGDNLRQRMFRLANEVCAQTIRARFVKFGRFDKFTFSQRVEDDPLVTGAKRAPF